VAIEPSDASRIIATLMAIHEDVVAIGELLEEDDDGAEEDADS
jgi:hypothetical protein